MAVSKKTKIIRILLFSGTAISLYFVPWTILWLWLSPLPNSIQEQVDATLKYDYDGMIVYIDQKGKDSKTYTTGWHDRDQKIPTKPNALFKIASIGKLFTATTIAKLHVAGKLSLDQTIDFYFPEYSKRIANADRITLRMLVQHRSGLFNYSDTPRYWENPAISEQETFALIFDKAANFEPNADYQYSNTNYFLLGMIVNKVLDGKPNDFIQSKVLNPLNMKNTYFSLNDVNSERVMGGYHWGYADNLKGDDLGMVATAEDIGIFIRALNDGSLLSKEELTVYSELYEFEHSGWVPGYQSFARYYKDIDAVIILFNNTTDKDLYLWNLSEIFMNRIEKLVRIGVE